MSLRLGPVHGGEQRGLGIDGVEERLGGDDPVSVGRDDDALELLRSPAAVDYPHKFDRLRAWAAHRAGDVDGARRIWDHIRATQSVETIRPIRDGELTRVDDRPMLLDADRIRVLTVIRNERWRLPWFLDYYRGLGVDEFYFVDNDSTDGSLEYLRDQPDVRQVLGDQERAGNRRVAKFLVSRLASDYPLTQEQAVQLVVMASGASQAAARYHAQYGGDAEAFIETAVRFIFGGIDDFVPGTEG